MYVSKHHIPFYHINIQTWFEPRCFLTSQSSLAPQRHAFFPHLKLPKVFRTELIPTSLASVLLDPPEPQALDEHSVLRFFYLFGACIFCPAPLEP